MGIIAETAVYKHIKAFYYDSSATIGYYRDQAKILETDAIVELANEKVPNLVITKRANDFGECDYGSKKLYRIPAPAFLYLLGLVESQKSQRKA